MTASTAFSGLARLRDPSIPHGWTWESIGDVADCRLGKMLDKAKNKGKEVPYLRNINVQWYEIHLDDLKTMRFEAHEVPDYALSPGDVLVCEGGEPGRAAVWRHHIDSMVFQKALHRVRTSPDLDPDFFCHWMRFVTTRGWLDDFLTGSTIKHFPANKLAALPIALPPIERQVAIVQEINTFFMSIERLEAQLDGTLQRLRTMRLSVLSRGFSGEGGKPPEGSES